MVKVDPIIPGAYGVDVSVATQRLSTNNQDGSEDSGGSSTVAILD